MSRPHRPWHALERRETSRQRLLWLVLAPPNHLLFAQSAIVQRPGHSANQTTSRGAIRFIVRRFAPVSEPSTAAGLMILHDTGCWPYAPGL